MNERKVWNGGSGVWGNEGNTMRYDRVLSAGESMMEQIRMLEHDEWLEFKEMMETFLKEEHERRFGKNERPEPPRSNNY